MKTNIGNLSCIAICKKSVWWFWQNMNSKESNSHKRLLQVSLKPFEFELNFRNQIVMLWMVKQCFAFCFIGFCRLIVGNLLLMYTLCKFYERLSNSFIQQRFSSSSSVDGDDDVLYCHETNRKKNKLWINISRQGETKQRPKSTLTHATEFLFLVLCNFFCWVLMLVGWRYSCTTKTKQKNMFYSNTGYWFCHKRQLK